MILIIKKYSNNNHDRKNNISFGIKMSTNGWRKTKNNNTNGMWNNRIKIRTKTSPKKEPRRR